VTRQELRRGGLGRAAAGLKNGATRRKMGISADPTQRWPEAVNKGHEIEQAVSFMASPVPMNKRTRDLREGTERGKGRRGRRRGE